MKFTREHREFAKAIVQRNKIRVGSAFDTTAKETNNFFYWIMEQMLKSVEDCNPAQNINEIKLVASIVDEKRIWVQNGRMSYYWPDMGLNLQGFFNIMESIAVF